MEKGGEREGEGEEERGRRREGERGEREKGGRRWMRRGRVQCKPEPAPLSATRSLIAWKMLRQDWRLPFQSRGAGRVMSVPDRPSRMQVTLGTAYC